MYKRVQATALADEKEGLKRHPEFIKEGSEYSKLQTTKPQTIGYNMADSPTDLRTWTREKLHDWTDEYP